MRDRLKPHIFLAKVGRTWGWRYLPSIGCAYNEGINQAANAFCIGLNHRQFGSPLF